MATVALVGTCDTKLEELLFLRSQILQQHGVQVFMIDVGRSHVSHQAISITRSDLVTRFGGNNPPDTSNLPRSDLITFMSSCATNAVGSLFAAGRIHGIISAGGSGGTSLAAPALRTALPIGFPKLIVSTVASGDTGPYVGESDIAMLYSVVDIAGLNPVLRDVLGNAAAFIAAAALGYAARQSQPQSPTQKSKKRMGITMFGVTTPAVDAIRRYLSDLSPDYEILVFHATGHGGRAMEKLICEGAIDAVIDLTTTEVCDLVVPGSVMSAGPERLSAAAEAGIPCVVSLGATDMVNFGPKETVPERYAGRKLYVHNSAVTLMRVDENEARKIGAFIAGKVRASRAPGRVEVWIPKGGISVMSKGGGVFEDRRVDEVLFGAVKEGLEGSGVRVVEDERDVNDGGFARDVAAALVRLMGEN
ncbi:hypothetical protein QBC34DRAFT_342222 [Podospora aff. communis PSN243]|uniref:Uncharacterized protein n=1 Tax=Podospora aff. communis PSN243 TaxID=3040156 RepID=A0AAV9H225_9PEZI|nr:hypothetical protein QBC34DRAFT_342222 [Podospora aff. communis PSN243]